MTEEIQKTKDVGTSEDVYFRDMLLSQPVLAGLTKCNFEKPSPIQLRAIPIGSCGLGKYSLELLLFTKIPNLFNQFFDNLLN